ncbi:glycosyltransferase family 2 protein [Citrobacter freundii]|uniref:glycosyltransferase family 2 protein n=1 Tax=Citrobacter freundii TaxID=546 RepID=UPI0015EA1A42|nr:glycosyltransferase family 2 protein [Citrobacter freundii]QMJ02407.1 glycosyltransferase family 2 protein [Citrobacter freundii]QMJ11477.1 glycosyltransferase family 2 protein [Citrobacter freundii]
MSKSAKTRTILPGVVKTLDTGREKPFVSVVTPTWNRAAFLPWLLYMFRYQDYPADRRELVILDDSPQSHLPLIEQLTQGKPGAFNIRYIHHPERLALGKKRNMLNELAQGEYILCMDDDDFYPADKITYTLAMMQRHRALISGSDQIPIWYSHINRIFKTHRFGPQNILNGTFCYHRNYLKKHRYDDECNLSEEAGFTHNFTVNPLQLPGERTILCISHSQNTFDKDFVLGASEPLQTSLEQAIPDPMLKNWYQSLHNATHHQPIHWDAIDQVVIVNLDARADRLGQIQQELARLRVPAEKITRLAACEDVNGQLGRRQSHLQALHLAQQQGWKNYLLLEDDTVILKQEKHISVLNALLSALPKLPWEVILLGGEIKQGTVLKSLNGMIHARDCRKVCAYLVNDHYYASLARQMAQDPSESLEAQWQPLLRDGKWLACYPSIAYQRAGYSDIEKQETDNIRFYFNKINKSPAQTQKISQAIPNSLGDTIGFLIETAFHYQIYRPIIAALQARGRRCALLVNDRMPKSLLDEMLELLPTIRDSNLGGNLLSRVLLTRQRYQCLVSPYYIAQLNALADVHVRAIHGLANECWSHAWWNTFYPLTLCFAPYTQRALDINGSARIVGNPRFDDWHNEQTFSALPSALKLDAKKPTLLYIPTYSAASSLPGWAENLSRLSHIYNLVLLIQHPVPYASEGEKMLPLMNRWFKKQIARSDLVLPALAQADCILTDSDEWTFDALHINKPVIQLAVAGVSAQNPASCIQALLPVAHDMPELRSFLADAFDWASRQHAVDTLRRQYCDAFMDGKAGERAASAILDSITYSATNKHNALLTSLQEKLFAKNMLLTEK